jgi:ketosteroid isomerase-like protein
MTTTTSRLQTVDRYMEGFRRSDHATILACLTDDVVWHVHGVRTTNGKAEFDDEIENPAFEGSPELAVDRTIEAGDVVVVTGTGTGRHREAGRFTFAYNDLFTFRDVKHRSKTVPAVALTPRNRTPWLRMASTPASRSADAASATSGVTDCAWFACV